MLGARRSAPRRSGRSLTFAFRDRDAEAAEAQSQRQDRQARQARGSGTLPPGLWIKGRSVEAPVAAIRSRTQWDAVGAGSRLLLPAASSVSSSSP